MKRKSDRANYERRQSEGVYVRRREKHAGQKKNRKHKRTYCKIQEQTNAKELKRNVCSHLNSF